MLDHMLKLHARGFDEGLQGPDLVGKHVLQFGRGNRMALLRTQQGPEVPGWAPTLTPLSLAKGTVFLIT